MVPDSEADRGEWPGRKAIVDIADNETIGAAPGDPPEVLGDQRGLNA